MAKITTPPVQAGYSAEWLKLEQKLGTRPCTSGLPGVDIPFLNNLCVKLASQWPPVNDLNIVDEEIVLDNGNRMKCRVYHPQHAAATLPIMVYFHGGGYRSGNLDTEEPWCKAFAHAVPCVVASIDYPLTHRVDGSLTGITIEPIISAGVQAVDWAIANATRLGGHAKQLVVAGGSAGAALAAQVAYHLMVQGSGNTIAGTLMFNPITVPVDYSTQGAKYSHLHTSYDENRSGVPIISTQIIEDMHVSTQTDPSNPRHFPGLGDLSKFPPTYIMTAEKDPVRDDGTVLHAQLKDRNVKTKLAYYPGLPHYFHLFPEVPTTHRCMADAIEGVKFILEGDIVQSRL